MAQPSKPPAAPAGGRAATKKELPPHFQGYKHVWVFIEQERGQVHPVSWELMGAGRQLADKLKVDLAAVVLGPKGDMLREVVAESFCYGADIAYVVADDLLTDYRNEPYTKAMTDLVKTYKPEILLLGASTLGRDLAGAVATTLLTGLTADCTGARRRRRRLARGDAPDIRRLAPVRDLHPQLPPADGDLPAARHGHAGAGRAGGRQGHRASARPG
jgi:electron transfer flavoprotein alpha subunit